MEQGERERLSPAKAMALLLDECRMVLPGIQALLGFQLIVVFGPGFEEKLGAAEQRVHLLAITLVAVAVAIIMTPAAYNRQTTPREASESLLNISTRLLLLSMPLLAVGICLDFYLIADIILGSGLSALLAAGLFAVFVALWLVLPRVKTLQRLLDRRR